MRSSAIDARVDPRRARARPAAPVGGDKEAALPLFELRSTAAVEASEACSPATRSRCARSLQPTASGSPSERRGIALRSPPLSEPSDSGGRSGEDWLAGDAAHMCALAAPDRDGFVEWTNRGLELADSSEAASYWLGPLLNNLGWEHFDAGEHQQALDAFEQALEVRLRDPGNQAAIEHAREAVAEARRALGQDA